MRKHDALSSSAGRLIRLEKGLDHELQVEIDLRPTALRLYCVVCVSHTKLKDASVQKRAGRSAYQGSPAGVVDLKLYIGSDYLNFNRRNIIIKPIIIFATLFAMASSGWAVSLGVYDFNRTFVGSNTQAIEHVYISWAGYKSGTVSNAVIQAQSRNRWLLLSLEPSAAPPSPEPEHAARRCRCWEIRSSNLGCL